MSQMGLHISIGTGPVDLCTAVGPGQLTVAHDLHLVKAALLYADRATLYSPTASVLLSVHRLRDPSPHQQQAIWESMIPYIEANEQQTARLRQELRQQAKLRRKQRPSTSELRRMRWFDEAIGWDHTRQVIDQQAQDAGLPELLAATRSGLLEVRDFAPSRAPGGWTKEALADLWALVNDPKSDSKWTNKMMVEFWEAVSRAVTDGTTYPLFDEQTSELVRAAVEEGKIAVSERGAAHGRHSGLAAHLLERLPHFESARIDEVLDIRKELDRPLTNFRKAVIDFSKTIKTASWDKDFPGDADELYHRDVRPAVLEIEEQVRSKRFLVELLGKAVPYVSVSGSSLVVAVSKLPNWPELVSQVATVAAGGAAAGAAKVLYETFREWDQQKKATERNLLYFYHRAGKRLEGLE